MSLLKNGRSDVSHLILMQSFQRLFTSTLIINISMAAASFADGLAVSRFLDSKALASYGIAVPYFGVLLFIGSIVESGVKLKVTEAYGKGDVSKVNDYFVFSFSLIFLISMFFTVAGIFYPEGIARFLGANDELIAGTAQYIQGLSFGCPFVMLCNIITIFYSLGSTYRFIKPIASIGIVLYILFDLITGLICPSLFAFAAASSLGYVILFSVEIICLLKHSDLKFRLSRKLLSGKMLKGIIQDGQPIIVRKACSTLCPIIMNFIFIYIGGTVAISVFSVRSGMNFMVSVFSMSIGTTFMVITRYLYSGEDKKEIRFLFQYMLRTYFLIGIIISVFLFVLSPFIADIYGYYSGDIRDKTVLVLRCNSFEVFFYGFVSSMVSYMNAIKRYRLSEVFTVLNNLVCLIVTTLSLFWIFGKNSLWYSYLGASILTILILLSAQMICSRMGNNREDGFLFLEKWPGEAEENILSMGLHSQDDMMELLKGIEIFLQDKAVPQKQIYKILVVIEEIALNFKEHGISGKREKLLSVRFVIKKDYVNVFIQDNCRKFNIVQYFNEMKDINPYLKTELGTKIIMNIADTVDYTNTFNLNCINLKFDNRNNG